ncbi:Sec-independent protein translocase subunit TatA [Serratia sp. TSA_198.1]|uniref:Sec-independent protein translocase subunit TatA n=1 Tax=Serratia sp. TSA_198.1 TaxID=3415664 RepID=UPI004045501E
MEGISITKLLVIAVLVILLFGTSKLRTLGADLGAALKGFKKAVSDDTTPPPANTAESQSNPQSVEKKDV